MKKVKRLSLLIAIAAAAIVSSCKKSNTDTPADLVVGTVTTNGCKIDGVAFTPTTQLVLPTYANTNLSITMTDAASSTGIGFMATAVTSVGDYPLYFVANNVHTGSGVVTAGTAQFTSATTGCPSFVANGLLTIKTFSATKITGTFRYNCVNAACVIKNVTDGIFSVTF
jgi:hypothetical protein